MGTKLEDDVKSCFKYYKLLLRSFYPEITGGYEGNVQLSVTVKRDRLLQNDPLKVGMFSLN